MGSSPSTPAITHPASTNRRTFLGGLLVVPAATKLPPPLEPTAAPPALHAFVVGTDRYTWLDPLRHAAGDAATVARRLSAMGYSTISALDADKATIESQFAEFKSRLSGGGAAFLYLAGHGVQLRGTNYLLPRDADCSSAEAFDRTALSLSELMRDISGLRPEQAIVVIDACRNPLRSVELPNRQAGLSSVSAPGGFYLLYSAGAGEYSLESLSDEDPAGNSVFARHFLRSLAPRRPSTSFSTK